MNNSRALGGIGALRNLSASLARHWTSAYGASEAVRWVGSSIVRWAWAGEATTAGAEIETVIDLFDYDKFSPATLAAAGVALPALSGMELKCAGDGGRQVRARAFFFAEWVGGWVWARLRHD